MSKSRLPLHPPGKDVPETPAVSETQPQRTLRKARSLLAEIEKLIQHTSGRTRQNLETARTTANFAAMFANQAQRLGEAGDLAQAAGALAGASDALRAGGDAYHAAKMQIVAPAAIAANNSRKGASAGGSRSAQKKKNTAEEWQVAIDMEVRRLLAAGKSDSDIAGKLNMRARRTMETVRKYVAEVRQAGPKK